jgi:hypothetical protein
MLQQTADVAQENGRMLRRRSGGKPDSQQMRDIAKLSKTSRNIEKLGESSMQIAKSYLLLTLLQTSRTTCYQCCNRG